MEKNLNKKQIKYVLLVSSKNRIADLDLSMLRRDDQFATLKLNTAADSSHTLKPGSALECNQVLIEYYYQKIT